MVQKQFSLTLKECLHITPTIYDPAPLNESPLHQHV